MNRRSPILVFACFLVASASTSAQDIPRRLTVHGNGTALGETPLAIPLDDPANPDMLLLTRRGDGKTFPAEIGQDGETYYLRTVLDRVKAEGAETYTIRSRGVDKGASHAGFAVDDGPNLMVAVAGKPFAELRAEGSPKPYLFPILGPSGLRMTRAFPMEKVAGEDEDHPHQRSFWFTHGKVNGVDFWSEQAGHGSIRERDRQGYSTHNGSTCFVDTKNDWLGPDGKKICEDERHYKFYATKSIRIIDFDVTVKATDGPVTFGDTKEGSFGLRVASTMDVKRKMGGKITNAEGLTDAVAWGKASPWVDYTGPVDGKTVGVAILNHPSSFRYPTTWHVRDYGLFAANPFGWHDFGLGKSGDHTIPTGGSMTLRYRVIFHDGDTASADIASAFKAYAEPPKVVIE